MALENQLVPPTHTRTPSSTRNSLIGALAIGASTLFSTNDVFAQQQSPSVAQACPAPLVGLHSTREWYESGIAYSECANNAALTEVTRQEYFFHALECFVHAATDSTDIASVSSALPQLHFNVRETALKAFGLRPLALPLSISRQVTPEQVATRRRENDAVKAANIQAIADFIRRLAPSNIAPTTVEGRTITNNILSVRSSVIQLLRITDANLSLLISIYHDSLLPSAASLQICDGTRGARVNGETFNILNSFLCARAGALSYENFLRIATDPNLASALPSGHQRPTVLSPGRNSTNSTISDSLCNSTGISGRIAGHMCDMDSLVRQINGQFYLLHLYMRLVHDVDALNVSRGGVSVVSGVRLTNIVATTPETIAAVIEPENTFPAIHHTASNPEQNIPVPTRQIAPRLNVTVNPPVDTAQLARTRALQAYQSRVRMFRIIGLSAAGAGAITLGTGWGLSAANASEAQNVPNTPENRALHDEIEQIRAGVYHTQADVDHANARLEAIHNEFLGSVAPYQNTANTLQAVSYVGLGVMIAGGAVAALAPVLAGSPPAQPTSPSLVPTGGRQGPHPATPGRRTENEDSPSGQLGVGPVVSTTTVGVAVTGTF